MSETVSFSFSLFLTLFLCSRLDPPSYDLPLASASLRAAEFRVFRDSCKRRRGSSLEIEPRPAVSRTSFSLVIPVPQLFDPSRPI